MRFKKGDVVKVRESAVKDWKESGAWHWMFNGEHVISHYQGNTIFTTENLGIHNENELELVKT